MSHDQKSCDIYKRFNWHKQTSTTLELQPHHTMRPLSVDKPNIVISRLHSGQITCQISSSTGVSIGTISKIHSEHCSDLPKSSGGYPVKLSPASQCLSCGQLYYLWEGWNSSTSLKMGMKRTPSILPSILDAYPGPSQSMHPHSITIHL